MPFEYAVSRLPALAVARGVGIVNAEMWQSMLLELRDNPLFTADTPILIDLTDVTTPLRPGAEAITKEWLAVLPTSRGAMVFSQGIAFEVGRDIETMTGHRLRAFTSTDAALAWLRSQES